MADEACCENADGEIATFDIDKAYQSKFTETELMTLRDEFNYIINCVIGKDQMWYYYYKWLIDAEIFFEICLNTKGDRVAGIKCLPPYCTMCVYDDGILNGFIEDTKLINPEDGETKTFTTNQIAYVNYGFWGNNRNDVRGHLEPAIRPLNQLRAIEDALTVYRITRAPEKRIFKIYTGKMPVNRVPEYMQELRSKYRKQLTIDPVTGMINCNNNVQAFVEEDRETEIEELLDIVKAPDFPTGGIILGTRGCEEAYRTGRGKVVVRAVTDIEAMPNGKNRIIVTELPYMVNKAKLIEKIAELHKDKKIDGITDLRDESSREGMRVVIELRRDANANVILNQLYKHTQLQDTFGVIMLALVDNEPKVLNLLQILELYIKHQEDVITRRTKYDLNKAEERDHILQGLLRALDVIDEIIAIIRASENTQAAKDNLIARFGFTDVQAQAIVDMRLRALTGLEREKLENEHENLVKLINELRAILADEKLLLGVIKKEIIEISDKYGDDRRSLIGIDEDDITNEDLIPNENTVVAMTSLGYIKRMTVDNFKSQHRGGKGIKGMNTIEDDYIEDLLMTTTHHYIMFFTSMGRVYRLKAYEIPEAGRTARGTAIVNLLQLNPGEKISAIIPVKDYEEEKNLFMVTKKGTVKKTSIMEFANIRKNGLAAINLRDDDELIEVKTTDKDTHFPCYKGRYVYQILRDRC